MGTGVTPGEKPRRRVRRVRRDFGEARIALVGIELCNLLMKGQVCGPISIAQLKPLPALHMRPINVVVFHGSHREISS